MINKVIIDHNDICNISVLSTFGSYAKINTKRVITKNILKSTQIYLKNIKKLVILILFRQIKIVIGCN